MLDSRRVLVGTPRTKPQTHVFWLGPPEPKVKALVNQIKIKKEENTCRIQICAILILIYKKFTTELFMLNQNGANLDLRCIFSSQLKEQPRPTASCARPACRSCTFVSRCADSLAVSTPWLRASVTVKGLGLASLLPVPVPVPVRAGELTLAGLGSVGSVSTRNRGVFGGRVSG